MKKLGNDFFLHNSIELAPMLIGKLLCRKIEGKVIKLRILETEAYFSEDDTACHAHKGKTQRTSPMYQEGGITYVYLCYGIHNMLNVVSGKRDNPEAVLIRGVEGYDGPGKLTKALSITKELNSVSLICSNDIWIEDDGVELQYYTSKRVGIEYATEEYRNKPWRYLAK